MAAEEAPPSSRANVKLSSCLDRDLRIADPLVAGRAHTTRDLYKSSLRPAILILIHVP